MLGLFALHLFARGLSEFHKNSGVESYVVLQQQESNGTILERPPQDKAQRNMRRHSAEPQGNKKHIYRKL
jgi:hypothetical protein